MYVSVPDLTSDFIRGNSSEQVQDKMSGGIKES